MGRANASGRDAMISGVYRAAFVVRSYVSDLLYSIAPKFYILEA
jgi:hypothetical protein